MSHQNKATIRRIREEVVGSEDLSRLDGLYAANYQYDGGTFGELAGPTAFRDLLQGMSAVLADYRERVLDQVAEANRVVSRIEGKGKVVGELLGVAGNGRPVTTSAIVISAFNGAGQLEEEWVAADTLQLVQQLSS